MLYAASVGNANKGWVDMDNLSKYDCRDLIKYLCGYAGITMAELVRRRNELYPNNQTTPQNLSNKLYRGSLRVTEFLEFSEIVGIKIVFEGKKAQDFCNNEQIDTNDWRSTRYNEILELRKHGKTLAYIGNKFGISRERVRQILQSYKVNITNNEQ